MRQMLKKIRVEERGDTEFLPGSMVDVLEFNEVNEMLEEEGKTAATGEQIMLGITKASLATDSFLSAASFQETTKVLTEAAIKGKVDHLIGLKENVIIGKHIPAGTGMKKYRDVHLNTDNKPDDEIDFDEDELLDDLEEGMDSEADVDADADAEGAEADFDDLDEDAAEAELDDLEEAEAELDDLKEAEVGPDNLEEAEADAEPDDTGEVEADAEEPDTLE